MSNLSKQARLFKNAAEKRARNATEIIKLNTSFDFFNSSKTSTATFEILNIPYTNAKFHYDAVWYPVYHLAKLLRDLVLLAGALALVIQITVAEDKEAENYASRALSMQGLTVTLDFLNLILSSISLVTRTFATIANVGYTPSVVGEATRQQAEKEGFGSFLSNAAAYLADKATGYTMSLVESEISNRTFQF